MRLKLFVSETSEEDSEISESVLDNPLNVDLTVCPKDFQKDSEKELNAESEDLTLMIDSKNSLVMEPTDSSTSMEEKSETRWANSVLVLVKNWANMLNQDWEDLQTDFQDL